MCRHVCVLVFIRKYGVLVSVLCCVCVQAFLGNKYESGTFQSSYIFYAYGYIHLRISLWQCFFTTIDLLVVESVVIISL